MIGSRWSFLLWVIKWFSLPNPASFLLFWSNRRKSEVLGKDWSEFLGRWPWAFSKISLTYIIPRAASLKVKPRSEDRFCGMRAWHARQKLLLHSTPYHQVSCSILKSYKLHDLSLFSLQSWARLITWMYWWWGDVRSANTCSFHESWNGFTLWTHQRS